jgi:V8-like Glu-specific endopeptidase
MTKRLIGLFSTTLIGGTILVAAGAVPASAQTAPAVTVDFRAIVALSNCSGSVIKPANAGPNDPAMVLSNGHCVKFMAPGEVIVNQSSSRTFSLLNSTGTRTIGTLRATRLAYATMTNTDISIYRLSQTYAQIEQQFGTRALDLSAAHPVAGTDIKVVSGYWRTIYSCRIDAFVYQLRESNWTWRDSIRYTSASTCQTIGGTSGSPIIDVASGRVVGVNNTSNEDGQRCTLNNPCEVDQFGNVTVRPGARYGQQTYQINTCIGTGNTINLSLPGCALPKPALVGAVPAQAA